MLSLVVDCGFTGVAVISPLPTTAPSIRCKNCSCPVSSSEHGGQTIVTICTNTSSGGNCVTSKRRSNVELSANLVADDSQNGSLYLKISCIARSEQEPCQVTKYAHAAAVVNFEVLGKSQEI